MGLELSLSVKSFSDFGIDQRGARMVREVINWASYRDKTGALPSTVPREKDDKCSFCQAGFGVNISCCCRHRAKFWG